jgi:hypothetical protein
MIDLPTFKTYMCGYKNMSEKKTTDSIIRFCKDGLDWCPHQEIIQSIEVGIELHKKVKIE